MNDFQIDMHMHTTASDGTWTREELLAEIIKSNIRVFSVTDHDTYKNSVEMIGHVPSHIRLIIGAEVSSTYRQKEYHITAYAFNHQDTALNQLLLFNQNERKNFNARTVQQVKEAKLLEDISDFETYTYDRKRGGWDALNYLIDRKIVKDINEFFQMANAGKDQMVFKHPEEVIKTIQNAGGYAFLAHPSAYEKGERLSIEMLDKFKSYGISGIECYSPYLRDLEDADYYIQYCQKNDLMMSGGSDCHGDFTNRPLGVPKVMMSQVRLDFIK